MSPLWRDLLILAGLLVLDFFAFRETVKLWRRVRRLYRETKPETDIYLMPLDEFQMQVLRSTDPKTSAAAVCVWLGKSTGRLVLSVDFLHMGQAQGVWILTVSARSVAGPRPAKRARTKVS